jgi:3-hydroxyisobutyrate dehydrogenase-like beta-hydroxyacid dehydrogenase
MEGDMRIGFIGLGNMGGPMALNLIKAGHSLVVNDVRREMAEPHLSAGAKWAETAADVARDAELVLTSLPGPKEVEQVCLGGENGIIHGIRKGGVYADLSTNSPTVVRRLHTIFAEKGIPMLDTPVSGGTPGARAGTLSIMVGGDEAIYNKIKPTLDNIGDKVAYYGPIGAGSVVKLVHNMIGICTLQLLAEGFTLGVKAGVSPQALLTGVQNGAYGQGLFLKATMPRMIFKGNFDHVTFALKLARKDVGLATELAREIGVPMPIASLVEQDLLEAFVHGLAEKDSTAAFTIQEERAGVKVRDNSSK